MEGNPLLATQRTVGARGNPAISSSPTSHDFFHFFHGFKDGVDGNGNLNDYGDNDDGAAGCGGDVVSHDDTDVDTVVSTTMRSAMVTVMAMNTATDRDNGQGGGGDLLDLKPGSPELNSPTPLCYTQLLN